MARSEQSNGAVGTLSSRVLDDGSREGGTEVQAGGKIKRSSRNPGRRWRVALLAVAAFVMFAAAVALLVNTVPLATSWLGAEDANTSVVVGSAVIHDDAANLILDLGEVVVHDDAGTLNSVASPITGHDDAGNIPQ